MKPLSPPRARRGALAPWALGLVVLLPAVRLPEVTQLDSGRAPMRGLPGVAIVAEQVASEVRARGMDEDWLERRVRAALQRDSIPLLTRSDALSTEREPLLVVRLQTVKLPGRDAFAWYLTLALHQRVAPAATDAPSFVATTWEASASLGVTSGSLLKSSVANTLANQSAEFARTWRNRAQED